MLRKFFIVKERVKNKDCIVQLQFKLFCEISKYASWGKWFGSLRPCVLLIKQIKGFWLQPGIQKYNHNELARIGISSYPETFDMVGFKFSLMFSILLLASETRFKYGRRENADNDIFLNLGFDSILISSR